MDYRLRNAVAVSRHASFSRAAESLGVTQSAVTKSVADLERQIGFAIFYRTSKGVMPTEQGREFLDRSTRLLSDFAELLNFAERGADPFKGVLRVGIYPASLEWMLTGSLSTLVRKHPSTRIEISTGTSERGLRLLTAGDVDVAFGMSAAFGHLQDVSCSTVGELRTHLFVRRGHPLLELDRISLDDIAKFELVSPSHSAPYSDTARELYESHGLVSADYIHIVDFFPLARRIVAQSNAIGGIADTTLRTSSFLNEFHVLSEPSVFPAISLCCATRARWPLKPAAKALVSLIRTSLSQPAPSNNA